MENEKKRGRKFIEKSRENYRLIVMNNETFEEVGSYQLSPLNIYMAICAVVAAVAVLVFLLIVATPIKRYIPGYGNIQEHKEALRLTAELNAIKEDLGAQEAYTENIRKILVGDIVEIESQVAEIDSSDMEDMPDSLINVERIREDELLRKEIELNEQLENRQANATSGMTVNSQIPLEQLYFIPPISGGTISEPYRPEDKHYGIDVMAPKNTPIKAIMDGFVFSSDWTLETGNTIGIQHANNLISFYKHNSVLLKESGSQVKAGEAIAIIGNTGTLSSGPHLHFELWHNGKAVNPENFIIFDK